VVDPTNVTATVPQPTPIYRDALPVDINKTRYNMDYTAPNPALLQTSKLSAEEEIKKQQQRTVKSLRARQRGRKPAPKDFLYHHVTTSAANIDRAKEAQLEQSGTVNAGFVSAKLETTSQREFSYDYENPPPPINRTFYTKRENREYLEALALSRKFGKIEAKPPGQ
jgi:hypothetical protein